MRRGCMSLGGIECDICSRTIAYPERYLVVDEDDGVEVEKGKSVRYCVDCALKKGYAHYKEDKGERTLTFFPEPDIASE
jgi:nitrate reductase beta subunit